MPKFPLKLIDEWSWEGRERDECTELVQNIVKKMRQMQTDQEPVVDMHETAIEMLLEGIEAIYGEDWDIARELAE